VTHNALHNLISKPERSGGFEIQIDAIVSSL
jgi:hypothetical protein